MLPYYEVMEVWDGAQASAGNSVMGGTNMIVFPDKGHTCCALYRQGTRYIDIQKLPGFLIPF